MGKGGGGGGGGGACSLVNEGSFEFLRWEASPNFKTIRGQWRPP